MARRPWVGGKQPPMLLCAPWSFGIFVAWKKGPLKMPVDHLETVGDDIGDPKRWVSG